ncbi:GerMN domain-containing protein [Streptomyces sp. NPDC058864]
MNGARLSAPRPARALAAALLALALLSACGGSGREASGTPSRTGTPLASASSRSPDPTASASASTSASPPAAPPAAPTATPRRVRAAVYFLHDGRLSAAPRTVSGPATAAAALRALLAGPNGAEHGHDRTTAIPSGTALRSLAVRDRVATVDLSGRYDDSAAAGTSVPARLAQVVFTATGFPGVEKVRFRVDGRPPAAALGTAAGGRPLGRADFEDLSPAVLVESPLLGDTVTAPLRVHGTANTFEAEFRLRLSDGSGRTLADVRVAATSGSGTRGTFDVTVPYRAADGRPGPGTLTAYVLSAEDGHRVVVDSVPLTLTG